MSDQILIVGDHNGSCWGVHMFATLCLQFVDERLVNAGGGRTLAASTCSSGGVQLLSGELAIPLLLIAPLCRSCVTSSLILSAVTMIVNFKVDVLVLLTLSSAVHRKRMVLERQFGQEVDRLAIG